MATSRLHSIVPINAVAAEDGAGTASNGAVSSSSSPLAATLDDGTILFVNSVPMKVVDFDFCFGECFLE